MSLSFCQRRSCAWNTSKYLKCQTLFHIWSAPCRFCFIERLHLFLWMLVDVMTERPPELHVPSALCGDAGMICLGAVIVAFRPALVISTTGGARKSQTNALTLRLINLIHCKFSPILNDKSMKISLNSVVLFSHTFLSAPLHYYLAKKSNLKLQIKKKKERKISAQHTWYFTSNQIFFFSLPAPKLEAQEVLFPHIKWYRSVLFNWPINKNITCKAAWNYSIIACPNWMNRARLPSNVKDTFSCTMLETRKRT